MHFRQWTGIIREIGRVQHLNTRMLLTVERRDDRCLCPWLTAKLEGNLWIIEPETQMILMSGLEGCGRATRRDGKGLHIKDAAYSRATLSLSIGLHIGLVPGDTKRLIGQFDHKEIEAGVGRKPFHFNSQLVIE